MRKRYKLILVIIVVLLVLLSSITIYMKFFRKIDNENSNKSNVVHNINKYGYTLDDRDSELMKDEFYLFEELLGSDTLDYQEYAKSISKLFIIDLYTINNKINKYDIGGLEFVFETEQDKFKNIIIDSIYATVLDNSNHNREQELPEVKSVVVNDIKEDFYLMNNESINSYIVNISWDYVKDLGYDSNAKITLVKEEEKLYIVEYNSDISDEEVNE